MATIESQDLTLEKLFNDFYVVPDYQREYVWEEEHVTAFLDDIYGEFSSNNSGETSEYFIGSIIVCLRRDIYEVIDGQQRLTTAYLVLCAIKDSLIAINPDESIERLKNQISSTDIDVYGNDIFRYRISLQYEDSKGILEKIASKKDLDEDHDTSSVQHIKAAYKLILDFLRDKFDRGDAAVQNIKRFYAYFIKNVKLVRVKTASVEDALSVFAIINNRGVRLDAIDLLKNLMFRQARDRDYEQLKVNWRKMVDILFKAKEDPLRFLRYFIMAHYEFKEIPRTNKIYDWFEENKEKCTYQQKPLEFVNELLRSAKDYVSYIDGKDANKNNRYLDNMRFLSTANRQHLILLLASQHLSKECFIELCRHIENLFFVYSITHEPTRNLEVQLAKLTSELRLVRDEISLDNFIDSQIVPIKRKLSLRFENAFRRELNESFVQKKQMQYILAKLTQYIDEAAWGSSGSVVDLKTYINKNVELEHILPQNPSLEIRDSFDKLEEISKYIKSFGNLTLIEKTLNGSIGNKNFKEKTNVYKQSKFLLTKTLGEKVTIGTNTAVNRAVQNLNTFDEWTSESIEERQEMLAKLAKKVWDMPE